MSAFRVAKLSFQTGFVACLSLAGAALATAQTAADVMRYPVFSETRLGIFVREDVSRELGLSRLDEQRLSEAIDNVLRPNRRDETRRNRQDDRRDEVRGVARDRDNQITEADWSRLLRRAEDAAFRLFTAERKERITQITMQVQGGFALASRDLRRRLNLNYDQSRRVDDLLRMWESQTPRLGSYQADGDHVIEVRDFYRRQLSDVMTQKQRRAFAQMLGRQISLERGAPTYYVFPGGRNFR